MSEWKPEYCKHGQYHGFGCCRCGGEFEVPEPSRKGFLMKRKQKHAKRDFTRR